MSRTLHIVATSDVHGALYPFDFTTFSPAGGSLARVSAYVKGLRSHFGPDNVMLLDCGDLLQGQPVAYYYNYVETGVVHPVARMLRYMGYDAVTIGNHDIEPGHDVYDRFRSDLYPVPVLGANVADSSGNPYFTPYTIVERAGMRIAVIGLTTPAVPLWIPRSQWEGLEFQPMVDSARKWLDIVRREEHPDVVVGLFHSGYDSDRGTGGCVENASLQVAAEVPGFDLIIMGHDHTRANYPRPVPMVNPGAHAMHVVHAKIKVDRGRKARKVYAGVPSVAAKQIDANFMTLFRPEFDTTREYAGTVIGHSDGIFSTRDSIFGPSSFMTLLHSLQLRITGARVSLAAPLMFDAMIRPGELRLSDMFTLYRYENRICTVEMTGQEIKDYLELSYARWTCELRQPGDPLLRFADDSPLRAGYNHLMNPVYNFDSAQGIDYTVDVTRPQGEKVVISSFSDGSEFSLSDRYTVAMNDYRANGGGDLMTAGAGIPVDSLAERVVSISDTDMRHYLVEEIRGLGTITPEVSRNWRFVPGQLVTDAILRDRARLFH